MYYTFNDQRKKNDKNDHNQYNPVIALTILIIFSINFFQFGQSFPCLFFQFSEQISEYREIPEKTLL